MNAVPVCRRRAHRPCRLPSRGYLALTADGVEIFPDRVSVPLQKYLCRGTLVTPG